MNQGASYVFAMSDLLDDMFEDSEVLSTPEVARGLGISESRARSYATENDVSRLGAAYAWNRDDVGDLLSELEQDTDLDDDEEPDDSDSEDEGEDSEDED
jgi:hypothetical protein